MIVMKFGGTSVGSAARIHAAARIVTAARATEEVIVVVSAVGGVTDRLIMAAQQAAAREEWAAQEQVTIVQRIHSEILEELALENAGSAVADALAGLFGELRSFVQSVAVLGEVTPRTLDYIAGLGERLSSRLVAATLCVGGCPAEAVDATRFLVTDTHFGEAFPLMDATRTRATATLGPLLAAGVVPVVTGFIGATADGAPTTLGRGGSDYSAAIIGGVLDATAIIIWTDVDGVMTANPRVVSNARTLPQISYLEAAELSYFGAKVLHPKTIAPAIEAGIPVYIRNSFRPNGLGTEIGRDSPPSREPVRAITAIAQLTLLTVQGKGMIGLPGVAARVFSTVAQEQINVFMISQSSSEYNICLLIEERFGVRAAAALGQTFERERAQGLIEGIALQNGVSIVAVIGAGMRGLPTAAGRVFSLLGRENIEVLAIAQGSSELNLSFVLPTAAADHAVRSLHAEFALDVAPDGAGGSYAANQR